MYILYTQRQTHNTFCFLAKKKKNSKQTKLNKLFKIISIINQ